MLFETPNKTINTTSRQVSRPAQQTLHTVKTAAAVTKQPQLIKQHPLKSSANNPVAQRPNSATVTGFPHAQKQRVQPVTGFPHVKNQHVQMVTASTLAKKQHAQTVTGFPHAQKRRTQTVTGSPLPKKQVQTVTGFPHTRKYYAGNMPVPLKPGQKPATGWTYYRQGIRRSYPYYYGGNIQSPVYTNAPVVPQQGQVVPSQWNYNQNGVVNEPPTSQVCATRQPAVQNLSYTTSAQPVCHNCGLGSKGCTTLSRFAFNSSQLKQRHKNQLKELAQQILQRNINAVIATGHTDSSGTEDFNEALGAKRASAVISELRKQLSILKPNAHKNLFWKIDSKGEKQPVSESNQANNRRVEICVKHLKYK